jgi:hypothetical protein
MHFLFHPVDSAWSSLWSEAGLHPLLNVSRLLLIIALISLFFQRTLHMTSRIARIGLLGALVLTPLLVPSLVSALALDAALAWLSARTLAMRIWPKAGRHPNRIK